MPDDRTVSWRGRRVLVTGATGFIGSSLVHALLAQEAHVVCLVAEAAETECSPRWLELQPGRVQIINGRLERFADVFAAVRDASAEMIFHLGAQSLVGEALRHPRITFEVNAGGTWNLIEACRLTGARPRAIVVASSDKAYGASPCLPYRENSPLNGRFPYDASKACADLIAQSYAATYDLPIGIARCGNVFGPGDVHWSRLIPGAIRSLLQGRSPIIRSDGTPLRDWLYVDDAVDAYLRLAGYLAATRGAPRQPAFNFSMQQPLTVLGVVQRIAHAIGRADLRPRILDEVAAEIPAQHLDASRARDVLGWSPSVALDEAIPKTVEWYRRHLSAPAALLADW